MKELLLQIKQRTEKLLEAVELLEDLDFYTAVQDQKGLVEFLRMKLKTSTDMLNKH